MAVAPSLSSAGNSEPSGRARYSGREINSSPPRLDELPFKKISSPGSRRPSKSPAGGREISSSVPLAPFRQFHSSTPGRKEQFFQFPLSKDYFSGLHRAANSFSFLEMNRWASGFISWPLFAENPMFLGHEMNKRALPSISCPAGRERSFFPPDRREKLLSLFPGRAENKLFKCFVCRAGGKVENKVRGWGFLPSRSRSSGGGSCFFARKTHQICRCHKKRVDALIYTIPLRTMSSQKRAAAEVRKIWLVRQCRLYFGSGEGSLERLPV